MQRTLSIINENTAKSTNAIDIPPLITVWLQVRVPGGGYEPDAVSMLRLVYHAPGGNVGSGLIKQSG